VGALALPAGVDARVLEDVVQHRGGHLAEAPEGLGEGRAHLVLLQRPHLRSRRHRLQERRERLLWAARHQVRLLLAGLRVARQGLERVEQAAVGVRLPRQLL